MAESKYAQQVAEGLVEQLKAGTAPWVRPWRPGERFLPHNPVSGRQYHGLNAVWLLAQGTRHGYDDSRWMTLRQADGQGARVRKGEKGAQIQYWQWEAQQEVKDVEGRPVLDEAGKVVTERVRAQRPRVFTAVVFNAAQIDGLPPAAPRTTLPEWERHGKAEGLLSKSGATIRWEGHRAFYRPAEDVIVLPPRESFPSADGYYATALHELGHWTSHASRLNRALVTAFGTKDYAREELRAEIASMMLGDQLETGHDPKQHAAYIGSWIELLETEPRAIFKAAADAERIVTYIRGFERERADRGEEKTMGNDSKELASRWLERHAVDQHPSVAAPAPERTRLYVPFMERGSAKALGARWDSAKKEWYAPPGADLKQLEGWLKEPARKERRVVAPRRWLSAEAEHGDKAPAVAGAQEAREGHPGGAQPAARVPGKISAATEHGVYGVDVMLPALMGSEKQVRWGAKLRKEAVQALLKKMMSTEPRAAEWVGDPRRAGFERSLEREVLWHPEAKWWIEARGTQEFERGVVRGLGQISKAQAVEALRAAQTITGLTGTGTLSPARYAGVEGWLARADEPSVAPPRAVVVRPLEAASLFEPNDGARVLVHFDRAELEVDSREYPFTLEPGRPRADPSASGNGTELETWYRAFHDVKSLEEAAQVVSAFEARLAELGRSYDENGAAEIQTGVSAKDLPRFGGPKPKTASDVLSWDEHRLLVRDAAGDLRIVAREREREGSEQESAALAR